MNDMNIVWKKIIGYVINIFKYFIIERKRYIFYNLYNRKVIL